MSRRWRSRKGRKASRAVCTVVALRSAAVALVALGLSSAPAFASVGHAFSSDLTEAGGAPFSEPSALAVDGADGRLFVADPGQGVVDVFEASGGFVTKLGGGSLLAAGIAIDEASGLVYVADTFSDGILVFKPTASGYEQTGEWLGESLPGEEFGEVTGVAVDNSGSASAGDVYVVDGEDASTSEGVVDVFKPSGAGEGQEGALVRVLSKGKMEEPNAVAIDSVSGQVYVADSPRGAVYEFSPTGDLVKKMNGASSPLGAFGKEEAEENVTAVAIDPSDGDLVVAEAERDVVEQFNAAGEWVGSVPSTPQAPLSEPRGVAVASSGTLYLGDALLARVDKYAPGLLVPDAHTEKATKPTRTSVALPASVNAEGAPAEYFFEWGPTVALGASTAPVPFSGSEQTVSSTIDELHAGTAYFFRVVARNDNGSSYGIIREVTTPPAVEKLATGPIKSLGTEGATLTGTLSPNGFDAHYHFQWGTSTSYGHDAPELPGTDAGSEKAAVAAETVLEDLSPNTTYHYRLVGENQFGTTVGLDQKFTTAGPPRVVTKPVTGIGHEVATLAAEVNPGELDTKYRFEYGETASYGAESPVGGLDAGSGAAFVPVTTGLTGLKLGVTYHYRIVATNSDSTAAGPDRTFTTVPPALITAWASQINPVAATLNAQINPLGHDTTYYFQYGTEPCANEPAACASTPSPPGADAGAGEASVLETLPVTGLSPGATYHYRVVASNVLGTSDGAEHTFVTPQPAQPLALPDNRAWEMVTPPNKGAAPVEALTREGGLILGSEDGNKLAYVVDGQLGEEAQGNRSPEMQQVIATRGESEWTSQDIATPSSKAKGLQPGQAPEYQYFTPDLATALDEPPTAGPEAQPPLAPGVKQATIYLRDDTTGTFTPLVAEENVAPGVVFGAKLRFLAATPDLSSVVFRSEVPLEGPLSTNGIYEWSKGEIQQVSILPNGTAAKGVAELGYAQMAAHAVSNDGSRIVWTTPEEHTRGHLYLRDTSTGETIRLDAAQGVAEPIGPGGAQFQGSSSDNSRIFFTDKQRLTPDSTAEPKVPEQSDLYACDVVEVAGKLACNLEDLTVDHNEGEHGGVQGFLLGVSTDGADAYVIAQGVLASNEGPSGEKATPGGSNLYWLHFGGTGWTTTFVAALSSEDSTEWEANRTGNTAYLTARVSPNGRYLAFMSAASLTGYDNIDVSPEAKGARDLEVFLYDSAASRLTCVSCNPTGERPSGVLDQAESGEGLGLLVDRRKVWAELGREHWLAGNIPGWTAQSLNSALIQSRYLSDAGRLYFNSPDELVPAATNHKENVYEYEPSGVGSCESSTGGCVSLLSSGTSHRESAFVEATPDGSNVFFITEGALLPQDTDTAFDIYDARECTGASHCLTAPAPPSDTCKDAGTCRPVLPPELPPEYSGGTAGFAGPGNRPAPPPSQPETEVKSAESSKPVAKRLTRKQKLARALRGCRKKHPVQKRHQCEAHARKLYGAHKATKPTTRTVSHKDAARSGTR